MQIQEFRKGKFEDKSDHVKKAWLFCMMELMCYINTAWAKVGIKRRKKLSVETTPSDEALIGWFLICYVEEWTREVQEENAHFRASKKDGDMLPAKLPKRHKRKTEHYSRSKLFRYVELEKNIRFLRGCSSDWDDAITAEAERCYSRKAPQRTESIVREQQKAEEAFDLPGLTINAYRLHFTKLATV